MSDGQPLVTVATFGTLAEAEIAQSLLDSEGVRSFVADGETANSVWSMSLGMEGIKLLVEKSDFLAAERLLNDRRRHRSRWDQDDYGLSRRSTAISRDPDIVQRGNTDDTSDGEDDEIETNEADDIVDRAFRAAIFGLILLPPLMHVLSVYLLWQLPSLTSKVSPNKRFRLYVTIAINVGVFLGVMMVGQFCLMAPLLW